MKIWVFPFFVGLASTAFGEPLKTYASRCEQALEATIPSFSCFDGDVVPVTGKQKGRCDRPALFNDSCVSNSRLGRLPSQDEVIMMFMCRRYEERGKQYPYFQDISVIAHNTQTGATCFFQTPMGLDRDGRRVPSPVNGDEDYWLDPRQTAAEGCAGCHDNDPLIRTPFVDQVKGKNGLPHRTVSELKNGPYHFVGSDFKEWETFEVMTDAVDGCSRCHRMGLFRQGKRWELEMGTTALLGPQAAGLTDSPARNVSNKQHPWMPLQHRQHAEILVKCAQGAAEGQLPPGCKLKPISGKRRR